MCGVYVGNSIVYTCRTFICGLLVRRSTRIMGFVLDVYSEG